MTAVAVRGFLLVAVLAALFIGASPASPARAAFGPIELISKSSREQADFAAEPVISADGRYVAYCGQIGGLDGIFRVQLETGGLVSVAVTPAGNHICNPEFRYAGAPSISADGRYISFTTKASLVKADTEPESSDVYVADMATSPPTYHLVSTGNEPEEPEEPLPGGSTAAGRVALSADGSRVAFVNGGNVYVRDLAAERTILISARRDPVTGMTEEPVTGGGAFEPAGAAISADGSTVAWVGEHLPQQVPLLGDEEAAIKNIETSSGVLNEGQYHEPLWRRVPGTSGEDQPTRRIVGGGDPSAPGCPAQGTIETVLCRGPYPEVAVNSKRVEVNRQESGYGWGVEVPQLDADGDTVAFAGDPEEQYDLFVVDMQEGLDRLQAVHQVTSWINPVPLEWLGNSRGIIQGLGSFSAYLPFTGAVTGCTISPDGTRIAFTTTRQRFSTAPFTLTTEIPPAVSLIPELYELNLESDTIERATPGPGKTVSEPNPVERFAGAASPSFGEGDRLIAFASNAENLVIGDANEKSDAFLVESPPPAQIGTSTISPRPAQAKVAPVWRITANAYSRPDGSVRVVAQVPGQGTLRALARSQVGSRLKTHQVAKGRRNSGAAQRLAIDLKLGRHRRALSRRPGGLVTRVRISFVGPGGRPLHAELQSRFSVHRKHAKGKKKAAGR